MGNGPRSVETGAQSASNDVLRTVDYRPIARRLRSRASELEGSTESEEIRKFLLTKAEQYESRGAASFRSALQDRRAITVRAFPQGGGRPGPRESIELDIARQISNEMDNALATASPALRDAWVSANRDIHAALLVQRIAGRAQYAGRGGGLAQAVSRRLLGMFLGSGLGSGVGSIAGLAAAEAAEPYVPALRALANNRLRRIGAPGTRRHLATRAGSSYLRPDRDERR